MAYTIPGVGAPYWSTSQVSTGATSAVLVAARSTRNYVAVRNLDSTNSIYLSSAVTATTANSVILKPGESRAFYTTAAISAVSGGATPVAEIEEAWS